MVADGTVVFEGTGFIGGELHGLRFARLNLFGGHLKLVNFEVMSAVGTFECDFNSVALFYLQRVGREGEITAKHGEFFHYSYRHRCVWRGDGGSSRSGCRGRQSGNRPFSRGISISGNRCYGVGVWRRTPAVRPEKNNCENDDDKNNYFFHKLIARTIS